MPESRNHTSVSMVSNCLIDYSISLQKSNLNNNVNFGGFAEN